MEAIKPNELNTLITIMRNNNYEIKERPYELNIVGVRTDNWTPNSFDDFIFVFYKDDKGNWQGSKNPATTDPGTYWLKNPMSPQGTAILKKGQYKNSHAIGSHRGQYTALVQVAPVTTIRDFDRDNKLSYESLKATTGLYGINIHRAGSSGTTKFVDKYSAGCQVFSDANDFAKFIEQTKKHKDLYGNLFNYTLIDEREDAIRRRTKADTYYAGDYRYHENTTGLPIDIFFEGQTPTLVKPADGTTHCAGFTFAVFYVTALNRGLLNDFTDEDIKKMWGIWTEADGTRYPKMCVKAISEPMRSGLNRLGREVSIDQVKAGDFCQIWRTTGTTHQAIVVEKIMKDGQITGMKYLSSNPIINPDTNKTGIGVVAEFFQGSGGDMLRENTYFARLSEEIRNPLPTKLPETLTVATTDQIVVDSKKQQKQNEMKKKALALILALAILLVFVFWFVIPTFKPTLKPTKTNTSFEVINTTKDSVLMFLTINYPTDSTWVQSVDGIFGIKSSELQGSVWVQPNDTLKYMPKLSFSGNISFGSPPQNCPTDEWINGVNIFEWSVNVPTGSNEGLDLSCVAGVNSFMKIDLIGGADWIADGKTVKTIQNKQMWNNTGIYGVFPYGCTNCTNTDGKQPCQTPNEKPNTEKICTPTRGKNEKGGIIRISFLGYTPIPASDKKHYKDVIKPRIEANKENDND